MAAEAEVDQLRQEVIRLTQVSREEGGEGGEGTMNGCNHGGPGAGPDKL